MCGFHRVKIVGQQASPEEAKILAVAPHSTFFDALPVVLMGAPSVVAKAETNNMPFWGSIIKYTQPVLVHRYRTVPELTVFLEKARRYSNRVPVQ